jgi:hypothetical protein
MSAILVPMGTGGDTYIGLGEHTCGERVRDQYDEHGLAVSTISDDELRGLRALRDDLPVPVERAGGWRDDRGRAAPTSVTLFAWFSPTMSGVAPDFNGFEIVDTGATLRFGGYLVAVSAVLGQHDLRVLGGA